MNYKTSHCVKTALVLSICISGVSLHAVTWEDVKKNGLFAADQTGSFLKSSVPVLKSAVPVVPSIKKNWKRNLKKCASSNLKKLQCQ